MAVPGWGAPPAPDLVPSRSGLRAQAVATLSGGTDARCLTPVVQSIRSDRRHGTTAERRAIGTLANDSLLPAERPAVGADAIYARLAAERNVSDRIDFSDDNANGKADIVDEALSGAIAARRLLVGQLELASPGDVEILLGRLGSGVDGVAVPYAGRQARTRVWLDPYARGGAAAVRRAAEHQYAHAVADGEGLDPAWGEAFATWTAIAVEGSPDDRTVAALAKRLASGSDGLVTQDVELAAGNALWFAFLNDAYGPTAVKLAVEELGRGGSDQAALDRAMRRAAGSGIDAALRDYQVWSLMTGPRDDGKHFPFAARLGSPAFAASEDALPAMSIQADPGLGPMGQAAVSIRPDERAGGVTLRFEGDPSSRWGVDVLLVRDSGGLRRVTLPLEDDGAGESTLPVQDVREILLLVRDLEPEGRPARRYSWAAQFDPGFPAEFGSVRAETASSTGGALVAWDTSNERRLLGFNVLRAGADGGEAVRVNPVWIPSVGDASGSAAYSFYDATAAPGVPYRYRIEAVTLEGLQSRSDAVTLSPAP